MPGSNSLPQNMSLITILFTDVVESSATKRDTSLGRDNRERDHVYLETVQKPHFELVRACCQKHGGREVSTTGDAFFLTFEDPAEAVRCAVHIQKQLTENPIQTPRGPLRLRIGIHSGFPEFFEGSWHGTDVDTTARVEGAATERQILVSARAYELTCDMTDAKFYPRGEFALKGVGQLALWEVDWEGKGPSPPPALAAAPEFVQRQKRIKITLATVLAVGILAGSAVVYRYKVTHRQVVPQAFQVPVTDRHSVAVFAFENLSKPEVGWLSTALPELLNTELTASGELRAITGEDVATTKLDLGLKDNSSYGSATLSKIRKILHTDYVVAGAYLAAGNLPTDSITLDLNLQDAATGQTVATSKQEGTVGAYSDLLKRAGADLRNRLGVTEVPQAQLDTAKAGLPTNPEALRYYAEGLAKLRAYDALEARDLLAHSLEIEPDLAVAHSALANAWQMSGYDSKALEEAKKSIDNYGKLSPIEKSAIDGCYHELASQWDQAIETYRSLSNVVKDEPNYALELAYVQTAAGKGNDALATLAALRKRPNMDQDPRVDLREAFAAESLSEVKQQQVAAARAAQGAVRQGSRVLAAQAYWLECSALFGQGDLKKAEAACHESINSAPFDLQSMARGQTVLANIMVAQGNTRDALEMRGQILENARKIGSQKDIVGALINLANLESSQGEETGARQKYLKAIQIAREIGDKQQLLKAQNDLADDFNSQGNYGAAEQTYGESLVTAREIDDKDGISRALENLGMLDLQMGDVGNATQAVQEAIAVAQKGGMQTNIASSLSILGDIQMTQGALSDARKSYESALASFKQQGDQAQIANMHISLANLGLEQGKARESELLARQAAQEFQSEKLVDSEANAREILSRALLSQGKTAEAQMEIEKASAIPVQDRSVRISLAITAARIEARSGKNHIALQAAEKAVNEARSLGLKSLELDAMLATEEIRLTIDPKSARNNLRLLEKQAAEMRFILISRNANKLSKGL
jgi:eukaryotic-like serine/threonine-protein kinase